MKFLQNYPIYMFLFTCEFIFLCLDGSSTISLFLISLIEGTWTICRLLDNNNLSGPLPSELSNLPELRILYFLLSFYVDCHKSFFLSSMSCSSCQMIFNVSVSTIFSRPSLFFPISEVNLTTTTSVAVKFLLLMAIFPN